MKIMVAGGRVVDVDSVHTEVERMPEDGIYYFVIVTSPGAYCSVNRDCVRAVRDISQALELCDLIRLHLESGTEFLDVSDF